MYLAFANLMHHKARSLLSALAVGIGVTMLVTLLGLTNGSLNEVIHRMQAIDADLLIAPSNFEVVFDSGKAPFGAKHLQAVRAVKVDGRPAVARVAPVFRELIVVGKTRQTHAAFGISAADWDFFLPKGKALKGRSFPDLSGQESRMLDLRRRLEQQTTQSDEVLDQSQLGDLGGALELVIDQRLADFEHLGLGDRLEAWGCRFKIVGIAPTGVAVRVFAPLPTVRVIEERLGGATFLFVRLNPGIDRERAQKALAGVTGARVMTMQEYGNLLAENLAVIPDLTLALSLVTLTVAFLFVLVIMYTVVIQRTREIGILKSLGASRGYIVRVVLAESVALSLAGTAIGLALSFAARWAILHFKPLLTVDLNAVYLLAGVATGLIGGLLSGLYPAWVAARQDPVTALSYE